MLDVNKLLIVDDSIVVREILATLLRVHVDTIITAASVSEALVRLAEHRDLNLVICDVVLPDGDGFKVLEHIRELSSPRPHVILVTARPSPEDEARAMRMDAIGYLSKPTSVHDISVVWRRHLNPKLIAVARVRRPPSARRSWSIPRRAAARF